MLMGLRLELKAVRRKPMRRPSGSFPIRAPIGIIAGTLCATAILPLWFKLGVALAPELQRFYLSTYVKTGLQSALPNLGRQPVEIGRAHV